MSEIEIDLFAPIQTSTIDSEEQRNAWRMLIDLHKFSLESEHERIMSAWELQFVDDLFLQDINEKPFTPAQLENIYRVHTKYLVDEDY